MTIKEIRKQQEGILTSGIIQQIDHEQFVKLDSQFPIPSNIKLTPNDFKLTDDDLDLLLNGEIVEFSYVIEGTYEKTSIDMNSSMNNFIKLNVTSLKLQIDKEELKIIDCVCYISSNKY